MAGKHVPSGAVPGRGPQDASAAVAAHRQPYSAKPGETVKCPACGAMNEPDAKYCDQCGHKL